MEAAQPACCDRCSAHPIDGRLSIFSAGIVKRRKRRRVVRAVDKDVLEGKLVAAREDFLKRHSVFKMVGIEFVCPHSTIKTICKEAKYIVNTDDLPTELRSELKDIFFSIITSSSSSSSS